MSRLAYRDHAVDPGAWAAELGVSEEATRLVIESPFIDLHLDLEVPVRVLGFRPSRHHGIDRRTRPFMGHTDYPRLREARLTGVVYDIATNPFRRARKRLSTTLANVEAARARIESHPHDLQLVQSRSDYDEAVAAGRTAVWLALQGGNAVDADPGVLEGPLGDVLHRITLVHLTSSSLGGTSSPVGRDRGVTAAGRRFVRRCNRRRILVDLAHAGKETFWTALGVHDPALPPIVSHTGVSAVRPHWRNLDDDQIHAIADRGGVIGIMYQSSFLEPVRWGCRRAAILDHLQHVIDLVGASHAAIGTDYDGMIVPPADLPDITSHPLLVQDMLDRGWSPERIAGVLGGNYLEVVQRIRP
jgi:membrane dipeptidase